MRIADLLEQKKQFVSLEFFPPKEKKDWPAFFQVAGELRRLNPLFVSVTYGAGGGTQANTLDIVIRLKKEFGYEPMAHLTCIGASEKKISDFLDSLMAEKIDNILALGGDEPKNDENYKPESDKFAHASDLVDFVKRVSPDMGIGVAGYPETHPRAESPEKDIHWLNYKLDLGGDFVTTQLFFDNDFYWDFVARAKAVGVEEPIIPGVMPILNLTSVKRIASLCGAKIPESFLADLESAQRSGGKDAVEAVGIEYAKRQAENLLSKGAPGVHLYTLNKSEACIKIADGLI